MTIYRDGTAYLVVLDAGRAFLHRANTGETTAIVHPRVFASVCKNAVWEQIWHESLPESLLAAMYEKGLAPGGDPGPDNVDTSKPT